MTNRERLNVLFANASNKEVARHFAKDDNCGLCMFKFGSRECEKHTCYDGILKWLKSEAEE